MIQEIEVVLRVSRFSAKEQLASREAREVVADALRNLADRVESGQGFGIAGLQSDPLAQIGFFRVTDRKAEADDVFIEVAGLWGNSGGADV